MIKLDVKKLLGFRMAGVTRSDAGKMVARIGTKAGPVPGVKIGSDR